MSLNFNKAIIACLVSTTFTLGCFPRKANLAGDVSCNSSSCIENLCPGYTTTSTQDETSGSEICNITGSCEISNMPLTFQMNINIPGKDIACGPVSTQMIMNTMVSNTKTRPTGWLSNYSLITSSADPTGASVGYCNDNQSCRQVLSIANELIGGSWISNQKEVNANETNLFFEERATEASTTAKSFESDVFPTNIDQCSFATGDQSLNSSHPWLYSVLYLEYPVNSSTISKYNGVGLTEIDVSDQSVNGHYIAMKGYEATKIGINFKFHDPIYGVVNYFMIKIRENEPSCISYATDGSCSMYLKISELPAMFNGQGLFLVAQHSEIAGNNYTFKFIASISGITP